VKSTAAAIAIAFTLFLGHALALAGVGDVKPALPVIPDKKFNVKDFGAVGDGKTWDTEAFNKALAEVQKQGGGTLIVPKGDYLIKPIKLVSALNFHIEEGAVLHAPRTFTEWGEPEPETLASQADADAKTVKTQPLIGGSGLHDLAITGTGAIDGNGSIWWPMVLRNLRGAPAGEHRYIYPRTHMVIISNVQRMLVQDITLRNSPMFHLVPTRVTDLTIERVKVKSPENAPNTDAIDPGECTNVLIRDCDLDTGDDNVAIKTGGTNILIEDMHIKHGHGISIGSGTTGGVHGMLVRNCTFDGTDNGLRIKSMIGAGGLVEDIHFTNIQMKNMRDAIVLDLLYTDNNRPDFKGDPTKIPTIRNVLIENVKIESAQTLGFVRGLPGNRITGITFRNMEITADRDWRYFQDADPITMENVKKTIKAAAN
jgi:polygalacturonase